MVRPRNEVIRSRMQNTRRRDTGPERRIRSLLHARGLRFRVHARPIGTVRSHVDILFRRFHVAVFIDGCFWHGCPEHGTWPKNNARWWREKIEANQARDRRIETTLEDAGWSVVRIWEHEDPQSAAERVIAAIEENRAGRSGSATGQSERLEVF